MQLGYSNSSYTAFVTVMIIMLLMQVKLQRMTMQMNATTRLVY